MLHLCHISQTVREGTSSLSTYSTGTSAVTLVLEAETPRCLREAPRRWRSIRFPETAHLTSQDCYSDVPERPPKHSSWSQVWKLAFLKPWERYPTHEQLCLGEEHPVFIMLAAVEQRRELGGQDLLCSVFVYMKELSPPLLPSDFSNSCKFGWAPLIFAGSSFRLMQHQIKTRIAEISKVLAAGCWLWIHWPVRTALRSLLLFC